MLTGQQIEDAHDLHVKIKRIEEAEVFLAKNPSYNVYVIVNTMEVTVSAKAAAITLERTRISLQAELEKVLCE